MLGQLPAATVSTLTGRTFLPGLLSGPFHDGLIVVFLLAAALAAAGAVVSLFRGGVYIHETGEAAVAEPAPEDARPARPATRPAGARRRLRSAEAHPR